MRQVFLVLHHQIEPAAHQDRPFACGRLPPLDLCPLRRLDGAPGFVTAALRDLGNDLARCGIRHRECLVVVSVDPPTVDVGAGLDKGAVGELHAVTSRMAFL
jgi:hypothetical protein